MSWPLPDFRPPMYPSPWSEGYTNQPVIEVRDVWVAVGGVSGVSFSVQRGEFAWLSGKSGSGKSTILAVLEGLIQPERGEACLFGQNMSLLSTGERQNLLADRVGVGFQVPRPIKNASIVDNFLSFAEGIGRDGPELRPRIARLLRYLGLAHKFEQAYDTPVGSLSGGEQQKVVIGSLLATGPEVVLVDEPTGMLDAQAAHGVFQLLRQAVDHEGTTVLMVSHDDPRPVKIDHEIRLHNGQVAADVRYS